MVLIVKELQKEIEQSPKTRPLECLSLISGNAHGRASGHAQHSANEENVDECAETQKQILVRPNETTPFGTSRQRPFEGCTDQI